MIPQSRLIIYIALAGLLAMLGGITWYASLDNPQLEQAQVDIGTVKVTSVNTIDGTAKLEVGLVISNPSEKTFTISRIDYELSANGIIIGRGQYSAEDVAMPGRAAFYPGAQIELPSIFQLAQSTENSDIYNIITTEGPVVYSIKGMAVVESAWSLVEKEFQSSQ